MTGTLKAIVKMSRPLNLFIILLLFYIIRLSIVDLFIGSQTLLSELAFFVVAVSTVSIAAGGYIINDYFDRHIDAVNKPDKIVIGEQITSLSTIQAHFFFSFAGILLGSIVAFIYEIYSLAVVQTCCVFALFYYSLRIKNYGLWGNLLVSLLVGIVPLIAGYYEFAHPYMEIPMYIILGFSIFAFLFTLIREIVKDFEDIEGDRQYGRKTLPSNWGIKPTKVLIALLMALIFSLLILVQYNTQQFGSWFTTYYILFLIELPSLFILVLLFKANKASHYRRISNLIKAVLLFGILYGITLHYLF